MMIVVGVVFFLKFLAKYLQHFALFLQYFAIFEHNV